MKKILTVLLASLLLATALVSCDQSNPPAETTPATDALTDASTEVPTEEPTDTPTEAPTEELTVPVVETGKDTDDSEDDNLPYDVMDIPVGYYGETQLQGYCASGVFTYDEEYGCVFGDDWNNMLVVTNDTMASGKLTASLLSAFGNVNDNGIIFGLEAPEDDEYLFWEDGPAYYFLFISDASRLYLAKAGYNGQAWTELYVTPEPVPNYTHGETQITISVEFDGEGSILCYANGELLIDYYDPDPLTGELYGIRCEVLGVEYYNIVAEHD